MKTCPRCQKTLDDGAKFCDACGTALPETFLCPACGKPTDPTGAFCQYCGAPIAQAAPAPQPTPTAQADPIPQTTAAPAPQADPVPQTTAAPAPQADPVPQTTAAPAPQADPVPQTTAAPAPQADPIPQTTAAPVPQADPVPQTTAAPAPQADPVPQTTATPAPQTAPITQPVAQTPPPAYHAPDKKKKMSPAIIAAIAGGAAAVVVLLIAIAVFVLPSIKGGSKPNYSLYIKDREIYYTDFSKKKATQVTAKFVEYGDVDNKKLADRAPLMGYFCYLTKDGKTLFYPDKINPDSNGMTLYFRNLTRPVDSAIKVDSDIQYYYVNDKATTITYIKGDGSIYQYNIKKGEKDKVDSDVRRIRVSDDGKKIVYLTEENKLYTKLAGKDKEKIDSEVDSIAYLSDDFSTIIYQKEGSLYKKEKKKDKVKIASDVSTVVHAYDDGTVYYLKKDSTEVALSTFIDDDMKASDDAFVMPERPEYPTRPSYPYRWNYNSDAEYNTAKDEYETALAAYDDAVAAYNTAQQEYWDAQNLQREIENRNNLRQNLENAMITRAIYTLYFYDGKEAKIVANNFVANEYYNGYTVADETAVIIYEAYQDESSVKIKFSEISSTYEVEERIRSAKGDAQTYIAVKDSATAIDRDTAVGYRLDAKGKTVYFIDDVPEGENYGDLYVASISGGKLDKAEKYDSDVYTGCTYFVSDKKFLYFKDYKDGKGEMYINKEKIDYDVAAYSASYMEDKDILFYYTDWNDEKALGTLKYFKGKKAAKVADDVHTYEVLPNGNILYLYDFSNNYFKGELYLYKGGKAKKLDDDVSGIIPFIDHNSRDFLY